MQASLVRLSLGPVLPRAIVVPDTPPPPIRVVPREQSQHEKQLVSAARARLRAVCADMSTDQFEEMVREMVRIEMKYERECTPTSAAPPLP